MRLDRLLSIATLAPSIFVLADVKFTSPKAGSDVTPGSFTVSWTDGSDSPSIDDLSTYTLQLMVGGNEEGNALPLIALASQGTFSTGSTVKGTVAVNVAGPTKNGYYLKMTSTAKSGGTIINYSDRFNIPTMTGNTPPTYAKAADAVDGTDGPPTQNNIANDVAAAAPPAADGPFAVPYALQTGLTRYAPMQGVPPTKISAKNYTPLHPTSSYKVATAFLPTATVQKTVTQSQTFSVSSRENTVAPQSNPTDDMAKYLARWKD
ncbi:unnamed protein product [Zymoseptoria tritici ST99CH_1A5]|uniref:Uncharacterized protein n=4 Tax=Zymoseptoria tritici TaxID=1047171 RepID=F9XAF6_ZYMTI|nr:uncharacterized protein MYCGRDRAFT_72251 [Zymoseptoria tritici IPO323]SMQ50933.1 unnamed protein product [Zymoseptoria tritici ST99CH_3D7]SMR52853.1 unnamed protein product [Zymoseptoria tritici ST99CH_1E4]SMR54235.1 unnamed protein product [Zymoseptoria tritici ST99CH_3D1]SMY24596.1 unnamed protein product [Zymoseptoria tritici ST99CH_1A5]EGP87207.1 hypothetical protein MYCGRDRAFT_72251 [Zymoseptoria tritici IPO323]